MIHSMFNRLSFLGFYFLLGILGCRNEAGPAIDAPSVAPEDAATAALDQYDKDGDGALSKAELAACPGLLPALADRQKISKEEITAHLKSLFQSGSNLMSCTCTVQLDRRPLAGATVQIEPEPFLGGAVHAAEGITSESGLASLEIPDDQLPESQRGLHAVQPGIYKVKITHPSVTIPAKYNTETTLGMEINPVGRNDSVVFSLQSRG